MHRRFMILGVALVALIGLPAAVGAGAATALDTAQPPEDLAIPDHVGAPWPWTPTVYQSASQRAAVLLGGTRVPMETIDDDSNIAVVGGEADVYRTLPLPGPAIPGEDVILSPDGSRVAFGTPGPDEASAGIRILDLRSNHRMVLRLSDQRSVNLSPMAWSPDASHLAVWRDAGEYPEPKPELGIMEVASGRYRRVAELTFPVAPFGVAFTPDGQRLTYHDAQTVTTVGLDGTRQSFFTIPSDTFLAGKGAWRPDGKALTVSARTGNGWQLRLVDPATGATVADQTYPEVRGAAAMRLLGWQHDGIPVALAYFPETDAPARLAQEDLTNYTYIRSVRVLRLPPGAARPQTILSPPAQILALDVADQALTRGVVRTGDGAPLWPARPWWAAFGALLACTAMTSIMFVILRLRATSRRTTR